MRATLAWLTTTACLLLGCAEDPSEDRPPRLGDCEGEDCSIDPPGGGGMIGGMAGAGSDGGGADSGGGGDAGGRLTLSGEVFVFDTEEFTFGSRFTGEAKVSAEGVAAPASFSGSEYTLSGVLAAEAIWMDLEPVSTSLDAMKTILRVDPRAPSVDLAFAREAVLEDVGSTLLVPQLPDEDRGHAVLKFVDDSGAGIAGVTIGDDPNYLVAYDTGSGVFRDDFDATSDRGTVVLFNASALAFPGSVSNVTYSGSREGVAQVKLAQDTVTVVTIRP